MAPEYSKHHSMEAQSSIYEASSNENSKECAVYLSGSLQSPSRCVCNSEFIMDFPKTIHQQPCSEDKRRVTDMSEGFMQAQRPSSELSAEVGHLTQQLHATRVIENRLTQEKTSLITFHQREMDDLKHKFSEQKVKQDIKISLLDLENAFLTRQVHNAEAKLVQSKANVDDLKQLTQALQTTIDKYRSDSAADVRNLRERLETDKKDILAEHQKTKAVLQGFQSTATLLQKRIETAYAANRALESEKMRFKQESEEAKRKLDEYEAIVETLRIRFGEMETGMLAAKVGSDRMRGELEEYCQGTTELEAVNARLGGDLESAEKKIFLLTTNNELLLQTIVNIRSPNSDLEAIQAESLRLAQENLQLQERLLEYEEQEVERAVLDYEDDQLFDQPEEDSHCTMRSANSLADFIAGEAPEDGDAPRSRSASENDGPPSY
ncbi:uncharacterized protein BT62DRAFT_1077307 [Guyanagaster necrorhizus]|uniref:Uncharacterized protein n=1 Tax=Guyanagaster necrorhizus TaxID=856835 RepID=A0A9P7VR26_9AGAR|nr:uncharacterized protein BT62DRAFT_1077307 [Guyanagaster necrorhizus MCA 3950]KAG7445103.1 hypothetical protein BT62DRAFT_1077307 [Guyanagaster necrorhizus MCA 3950]